MQYLQYKLFHNMNLEYYKYDNKFEENETNIIFNKITNNFSFASHPSFLTIQLLFN